MRFTYTPYIIVILVSGCASMAPSIDMPGPPQLKSKFFTVNIQASSNMSENDNIVQMKTHNIPNGSSVVINVPNVPPKEEVKEDNDFSTSGYFHAAEQQIEKELIKHGFIVLSREKFEAKLRNDRGTVRGKGLRELTDITEVIRAAEDGNLKSDYLLQINEFTQNNDAAKYEVNLGSYREFQELMNMFPKATAKLRQIQYLPCSEFSTTLNAKLIHVQTGRIVWIGVHTASTGELSNSLSLRLGVEEKISNEVEVERFVASQNTESGRRSRKEGDQINFPSWKVSYLVPEPIVTKGYCRIEESEISAKSVRKELSKTVAEMLMQSIKVGEY